MPFKINLLENIGGVIMNEKPAGKVVEVDIDRIYPNPNQPIIVRRLDIGYELVAGERRLRAARLCGMTMIACIIVETTERGSAIMALTENMQRKDLNFFEEAEAISVMIELFGYTQEDVAVRLGKSQSYGFTERHARALLCVNDVTLRTQLIEEIYRRRLNVESTEKLIEMRMKENKEMVRIKKCRGAFKDVRLFVNTINHAVEVMKAAGIEAEMRKSKQKEYTEYVVRIPNKSA